MINKHHYFFPWVVWLAILISIKSIAQSDDRDGVVTLDDTVKGNQEQPKVLYIVPWQEAEDNQILESVMESRVNHAFGHVEPKEHQRKLEFIHKLDKKPEGE